MKAILFDVDDTLYDLAKPFYQAYGDIVGTEDKRLLENIYIASRKYSDEIFEKSQSKQMAMEDMFVYRMQKALGDFGKEITREDALEFQKVYARYQSQSALSATMVKLLSEFGSRWNLGVITNGPAKHQWDKINMLKLVRYIQADNIFVAGSLGVSKPKKEIFLYACSRMGVSPDEACFIGDSYEIDVMGARNAGLKTVWFHRRNPKACVDIQPDWTVYSETELYGLLSQFAQKR